MVATLGRRTLPGSTIDSLDFLEPLRQDALDEEWTLSPGGRAEKWQKAEFVERKMIQSHIDGINHGQDGRLSDEQRRCEVLEGPILFSSR